MESFSFSRFYKGEAFAASLARHEHYLATQMFPSSRDVRS
jgi:sterol 24-C-methyltransferase